MEDNFKLRSISEKENYATYLALPLLELSKFSFGEGNFMNSYLTINGQICVLVKNIDQCGWPVEQHRCYRTDMPYHDGILIVFKPLKGFEQDILNILQGKYSQLSEKANTAIETYAGMHVDFPQQGGGTLTSRLIAILRKDPGYRALIEHRLGTHLPEDAELEPPLRDQDILYDVDTDTNFIYEEYSKDKRQ